MIKKMMIAGLLIWGGSLWAVAQTRMTIAQLFERIEENSKSLRTSKSGVEAASIGIESAKSKKLPDLDASLSFSYIGNALMTDRDFSNAQGLKSPHFGNNFAFPGTAGGLCWWRHQRRHTPRRTGQAAGRGGRETHPSAGSLHRPGTVSGPLQDRQPYQGI